MSLRLVWKKHTAPTHGHSIWSGWWNPIVADVFDQELSSIPIPRNQNIVQNLFGSPHLVAPHASQ
eukprot:1004979-Pyramimonas_sp.AAC.1